MKKITYILLLLFFLSSLLVPTMVYNKIFFILLMGLLIMQKKLFNRAITLSPIIIFCIFLFGFLISFLTYSDRGLSIQFLLSVAVLFLIYPINHYQINMNEVVKFSGIIMVFFTGLMYIGLFTFKDRFPIDLFPFFRDSALGAYGSRDFIDFFFHIGTVPFLFLPFSLFFLEYLTTQKKNSLLGMLVLLPVIVFSAARGLWIICLFVVLFIFLWNLKAVNRYFLILLGIPIILTGLFFIISDTTILSASEVSNKGKLGHIVSFFDNLGFVNFFIGGGLASFYYSKGTDAMIAHTEVTPVDMLRYFGFILTPILYAAIIFPERRLKYSGKNKFYLIIFGFWLLNTFTNPIMFNSYGLLVVLWYWSKMLEKDTLVQP